MSNLIAFLNQNSIKPEPERHIISKRLTNKEGKALEWVFEALDASIDTEIRKSCTKLVQVPGRKGQYLPETDQEKYIVKMCIATIKEPNLHDKEAQDLCGVMCAEDLLLKMLLPGEYADVTAIATRVNGFDKSFEDKVETVKN